MINKLLIFILLTVFITPSFANKKEVIINKSVPIKFTDNGNIDAFGRLRVSNPETIFDSKNIYDDSDLANTLENNSIFYDNQETSGSGTSTAYNNNEAAQYLTVSTNTAGTRVRQTKQRFNYQPGKSMMIIMSFIPGEQVSGVTKREGFFDEKNGLFFEDNGTDYRFVRRTYSSGSTVDNVVSKSDWNIDKMDGLGVSGITLDFTKTQLLFIDIEWLGVGRVRMGWIIDGLIFYAHEFLNTNNLDVVYMSTPNGPLRSEITNDGTGAEASLIQICSTVISEGGRNQLGLVRNASLDGGAATITTENVIIPLIGIRSKSNYIGETIDILAAAIQIQTASKKIEYFFLLNPTITGAFTYVDETRSAMQVAKWSAASIATGGIRIGRHNFAESGGAQAGNAGSGDVTLGNSYRLGSLIDGTVEELVLCARAIGGSTAVALEASITWREL